MVVFSPYFRLSYNTYITLPVNDILAQDASYGDSTQLLYLRARFYNPADGRFTSRDTWSGNDNSPQTLNKWSYVQNNPIVYTDPSGFCINDDGSINTWEWPFFDWGPCSSNSKPLSTTTLSPTYTPSPTPSSTPSQTPSPTCTPTLPPTATATPTTIQLAILYIQNSKSKDGLAAYNYTVSNSIQINYNASNKCFGQSQGKTKPILVPPPTCSNGTPTYIAGTIAHEVFHIKLASPAGSLWEEYQAMQIGDVVRDNIIQAGYGNSSDMRHPLSDYTVNVNNPNRTQLAQDLTNWFLSYKFEKIYAEPKPNGWGVQPLP